MVKIARFIVNILIRLAIYILTGVVYLLFIITLTIDIFYNFLPFQFVTTQNQVYIIVTFLLTFIVFYLTIILYYLRLNKALNILTISIQNFFEFVDNFINICSIIKKRAIIKLFF